MKEAKKILNNAGLSLYLLAIFFTLVKDIILIPAISKIWEWTLMSTPYGFISNANIGESLLKSPWIILIGLILLCVFLFFSMWQVAAVIVGVAYACDGKKIKTGDMLCVSFFEIIHGSRPKNIMILIYTIIILPFTNVFQATEFFGAFVIPEYIQDFIDANLALSLLYIVVFIIAVYFALRWLYLLPAFFLKSLYFKKASKESFTFTKKRTLINGITLIIYGLIELIKYILITYSITFGVCIIGYIIVGDMQYADELFSRIILDTGLDVCNSICGIMLYLSVMCYIVKGYHRHCENENTLQNITLPELQGNSKKSMPANKLLALVCLIGSIGVAIFYVASVFAVKSDPSIIDSLINRPNIVAHKGYSSLAPENTMDAFELADKNENTNFIELDVWSSKDGIPVVIHNETIKAATGIDGYIYDYTYEELQKMPATYSMELKDFPNARIPSLEEVISAYADTTPIIIEIKGYQKDENLPAKVVALMEKYNCVKTSMVQSGDYSALRAVKLCNSEVKCGLILAIVTGDCYNMPYVDFLSVEHNFVTKQMINQLHKRGKEIYVWTVNYEESLEELKTLNIDGYITDYPDKVADYLKEYGSPFENLLDSIGVNADDSSDDNNQFEEGDY